MSIGEQDRGEQTQTWPKELLPEQNFYDQHPFKVVLDTLNYDSIPREAVQYALTRGAIIATGGRNEADKTKIKGAGDRMYFLYQDPNTLRNWFLRPYSHKILMGETVPLVRELLNGLREYELWTEYIASVFEQTQYSRDGTYILRSNRHTPTFTYQEWLVQGKIKYQVYQNESVIDATFEAFPQAFKRETVAGAIRDFGGAPRKIEWKGRLTDEIPDPKTPPESSSK